jgi:hippurate hydrolase
VSEQHGRAFVVDELFRDAERVLPDVIDLRRSIHQHPELGLELPRTQTAIIDALDELGLDIRTGTEVSSVIADLHGGEATDDSPTLVLRGDMDALPMPEDTGLPFASEIDGAMHACGHDAHVAMLVGAARLLVERRDSLAGSIRFMFQPGEEGFHGARYMIDDGLLDDPHVDAAFALHVAPNLPSGSISTRSGALMASADVIEIVVTGKGGHASTPYLANDPMPVAAEIVQALQVMVTRRINAFDPVVISITKIRAGTTNNVIPEQVKMLGTLRAVSESGRRLATAGIERIATSIAHAHEMHAEVVVVPGYPVTVNDDAFAQFTIGVGRELVGDARMISMPTPAMGAEDFSYVLQERPGALAFLGVCPPGQSPKHAHSCHSNRMTMDEGGMQTGIAMHVAVALSYLARPQSGDELQAVS